MAEEWTTGLHPFDAPAILRVLDAHGVRYVLVGGVAAIAHGYSGATFDADRTSPPSPSFGASFRGQAETR